MNASTQPTTRPVETAQTPCVVGSDHDWATKVIPASSWSQDIRVRDIGPRGGKLKTFHTETRWHLQTAVVSHSWVTPATVWGNEDDDENEPLGWDKTFTCARCGLTAVVGE